LQDGWLTGVRLLVQGARLLNLGLDPQIATKLAMKPHAHLVQYAHKLISTRRLQSALM